MTSLLAITGALVVTVFWLLGHLLTLPHDPREPPLIFSKIPFFGHVIGLLHDGARYYSKTAKECSQPIFTLGFPRAKMYVVTSSTLITACDRRAKVVSFAPYVVEFGRRVLMASQHGINLLSEDLHEENGPVSLRPETMKAMHQALLPSDRLEEITQAVLTDVWGSLESASDIDDQNGVPLFQWIRHLVSTASTNAVYGRDKNPMHDPEVTDGLWAVDRDLALLGLMVLPGFIAPEGSRGRRRFFDAFRKYYATGGLETASYLIKARYEVNIKHGVSDEDIARFDLGVCTALLVNTVPATYWTLFQVFSNQTLLSELQQGIEAVIKPTAVSAITVNIPKVIEAFPLLESVVKEVLRVQSNSSSARFLLEDTLIDDGEGATYLLKKDSFLVIPSASVHNSEADWGPTAQTFDPARFLKQQGHKVSASTYRPFGGGNALCPGRQFAMHEIMIVLLIMVLTYEIKPLELVWKTPRTKNHISTSILTPVQDFRVRIQRREEAQGIKWNFVWEPEKVAKGA